MSGNPLRDTSGPPGQMLVGVRDDGTVESGVEAQRILQMLHALSGGSEAAAMITPNAIWDVTEEPTDAGPVVLIDVPAGADLPYVFQDAIFVRVGSQTRQATGCQTRELIERRYLQGARWERHPVLEVSLKDLAEDEIIETARIAAHKRGWHFRDADDLKLCSHRTTSRLSSGICRIAHSNSRSQPPQLQAFSLAPNWPAPLHSCRILPEPPNSYQQVPFSRLSVQFPLPAFRFY